MYKLILICVWSICVLFFVSPLSRAFKEPLEPLVLIYRNLWCLSKGYMFHFEVSNFLVRFVYIGTHTNLSSGMACSLRYDLLGVLETCVLFMNNTCSIFWGLGRSPYSNNFLSNALEIMSADLVGPEIWANLLKICLLQRSFRVITICEAHLKNHIEGFVQNIKGWMPVCFTGRSACLIMTIQNILAPQYNIRILQSHNGMIWWHSNVVILWYYNLIIPEC